MPFHAQAENGICGPASPNDHGVLQKKQEWYSSNWQAWKNDYYAADTKVDTSTKASAKGKAEKIAIRDKYIDARLDLANEYFRIFVSDACGRGALLSTTGRYLYDGFETKLVLNQLVALRAAKINDIKNKLNKEDKAYSLIEAEQDLSDLELSSMLPAATNIAERIKYEALKQSAQLVPASATTVSAPAPAPAKVVPPAQ